jgi:hypothetical protein
MWTLAQDGRLYLAPLEKDIEASQVEEDKQILANLELRKLLILDAELVSNPHDVYGIGTKLTRYRYLGNVSE